MKAYKLFRKLKNGALVSVGTMPKYMRQCYSRTRKNVSKFKGGELFCFADLTSAKDYQQCLPKNLSIELWEVSVPKLTLRVKLPDIWCVNKSATPFLKKYYREVRNFWQNDLTFEYLRLGYVVDNCHSAPSVTLIKKIV